MKFTGATQKNSMLAVWLALSLTGCEGEDPKANNQAAKAPELVNSTPPTSLPQVVPKPAPQAAAPAPAKPAVILSSDNSGLVNVANGKPATQYGSYAGSVASRAVDGNVDGFYTHGSVAHTAQNVNAWLDIDLGSNERIDHINIWNRTDCCADRLSGYWILISKKPFGESATVDTIRKDKTVIAVRGGTANPLFATGRNIGEGRYVRIQLDGTGELSKAYLQLAEVEIYRKK